MTPDDVVARIDPQEVVDLALALGNIDSPTGSEGPAGQFVYDWLERNGFAPRKFALIPERFNVAAWLEGTGGRYRLLYNPHPDTTLPPAAARSAVGRWRGVGAPSGGRRVSAAVAGAPRAGAGRARAGPSARAGGARARSRASPPAGPPASPRARVPTRRPCRGPPGSPMRRTP